VFLHSLEEFPHTGCGCFRIIIFKMDLSGHVPSQSIGIMDRKYEGSAPDGRTWKDLYYNQTGKQTPGSTGATFTYLKSPKFLKAHGGWEQVLWVSPNIADFMGDGLPNTISIG